MLKAYELQGFAYMKKVIFLLIIVLAAAAALSAQTVLIAKEDTSYKKKLVDTLTQKLESDGYQVEIIDHSDGELDGVSPDDYGVVYVVNSGAQAKVRPQVLEWLASLTGNGDNVIVHTTKRTVWDEDLPVDSLSSASKNRILTMLQTTS
jgi:hypothetical protein